MKHPTYAADDVKAGQPVLVGDEFWSKPANGPLSGPFVADGMNEDGVGCGMLQCLSHANFFYSQPPKPKIEACVCGRQLGGGLMWGADDALQLVCNCGRRGPIHQTKVVAAEDWNADARKLKAKGDPSITREVFGDYEIITASFPAHKTPPGASETQR